jgi:hypothetical protein
MKAPESNLLGKRTRWRRPKTRAAAKPASEFAKFLDTVVADRYGTIRALAEKVGLSFSAFARGIRLQGTLGTESCLRLAAETGEAPGRILRMAGKADVADLIESLYGIAGPLQLGGPEREVLALWHNLDREGQEACRTIMRQASKETKPKPNGGRKSA